MAASRHARATPERADLVGGVAVRRDPVGADDREVDQPAQDGRGGGGVGLNDVRDALFSQLVCRQPGALEQWPGLVGVDELDTVALMQLTDHPECGAPTRGREEACVAVGQHAQPRAVDPLEQPVRREPGELSVRGLVLTSQPQGRLQHGFPAKSHEGTHLVDAPRQVDGRRACVPHLVDCCLEASIVPTLLDGLVHGDHHAQGPRDTQRWRASHGELADRGHEVLCALDRAERSAQRKQGLVEQTHGACPVAAGSGVPFNGTQGHVVTLCAPSRGHDPLRSAQ